MYKVNCNLLGCASDPDFAVHLEDWPLTLVFTWTVIVTGSCYWKKLVIIWNVVRFGYVGVGICRNSRYKVQTIFNTEPKIWYFEISKIQNFKKNCLDSINLTDYPSEIQFLRQVSGIKYLNQMSTYHLACGDSEIT